MSDAEKFGRVHGKWMAEVLLPEIERQALATGSNQTSLAVFVFASLSNILQNSGLTDTQVYAIAVGTGNRAQIAPETIQ